MVKKRENLFEKHKKTGWDPFDTYKVTIKMHDIVGGLPQAPELVEKWINAINKDKTKEERDAIITAHVDTLEETTEELKDKQGIGFARVDGQLCIEGRQVKAMLREAANIIKDTIPSNNDKKADGSGGVGIAACKSKVSDQVFVDEHYIPLGRETPDEVAERPIHVITPRGPRSSIKVCEVCKDVELTFTIRRHKGKGKQAVPEKSLMAILDYGQNVGLGADRSQDRGRFEVVDVHKV